MNHDFSKLRDKINEVYGTSGETKYAELLGLPISAINGKLNGEIPFSISEMDKTIEEFKIESMEIYDYFFKRNAVKC